MSTPDDEWQEGREVSPQPGNIAHARLSAPIGLGRFFETDEQLRAWLAKVEQANAAAAAEPVNPHDMDED